MAPSERGSERGFTLIEVLAAVLIVCLVFGLLLESVTRNLRDLSRARQEARAAQIAEDHVRELQALLDAGEKLEDGVKEEPCPEPDQDLTCQTIVSPEKLALPADYPGELSPSPLFTAANEPPHAPQPGQEPPLRMVQVRAFGAETDPNTVEPYVVLVVTPLDAQALQQLQQQAQQQRTAAATGRAGRVDRRRGAVALAQRGRAHDPGRQSVTPKTAAGFTLLEIMVAVLIMSIVLTFAFQAYRGIESAYQRVGTTTSRERAARIVLDRLERELVGTVLVEREQNIDPLFHPYFFFGNAKPYGDSEGDELRFVTRTPLRAPGGPPVGLEIVTYGAVPSQTGAGLALLRQAEPLPAQLAKEIVWTEPEVVVDNVALFIARYHTEEGDASEGWDSTGVEKLDKLPKELVLTVSLLETGADGQLAPGPEFTRVVELPVRPFKLAPEGAEDDAKACGEGMTVKQCVESFRSQIDTASTSLASAITQAQAQVSDKCWSSEQPSAALQRLKVLMGGVPGFDASECK